MSKYGNVKTAVGDEVLDSRAEARRYQELQLMERAGDIRHLRVHPEFELQPAFVTLKGKRYPAVRYVADFSYTEKEVLVVEDVKGVKTDVYQLKKKLFLRQYPTVDFREIEV